MPNSSSEGCRRVPVNWPIAMGAIEAGSQCAVRFNAPSELNPSAFSLLHHSQSLLLIAITVNPPHIPPSSITDKRTTRERELVDTHRLIIMATPATAAAAPTAPKAGCVETSRDAPHQSGGHGRDDSGRLSHNYTNPAPSPNPHPKTQTAPLNAPRGPAVSWPVPAAAPSPTLSSLFLPFISYHPLTPLSPSSKVKVLQPRGGGGLCRTLKSPPPNLAQQ